MDLYPFELPAIFGDEVPFASYFMVFTYEYQGFDRCSKWLFNIYLIYLNIPDVS